MKLLRLEFEEESVYNLFYVLSESDKLILYNMKSENEFTYEFNDTFYMYIWVDPSNQLLLIRLLDSNNITYICKDLTDSCLNFVIDLESILWEFVNPYNVVQYDNFILFTNKVISNNLNLDSILDKISLKGVDSLNHFELSFLKNIN